MILLVMVGEEETVQWMPRLPLPVTMLLVISEEELQNQTPCWWLSCIVLFVMVGEE